MFGIEGDGRHGVVSTLYVFVTGVIASKIPLIISTKTPFPSTLIDMKGGTSVKIRNIQEQTYFLNFKITLRSTPSSILAAILMVFNNQKTL